MTRNWPWPQILLNGLKLTSNWFEGVWSRDTIQWMSKINIIIEGHTCQGGHSDAKLQLRFVQIILFQSIVYIHTFKPTNGKYYGGLEEEKYLAQLIWRHWAYWTLNYNFTSLCFSWCHSNWIRLIAYLAPELSSLPHPAWLLTRCSEPLLRPAWLVIS